MAEYKIRQAGGVGYYTDWASAIAAADLAHGGGLAEDVYILCYDDLTYVEFIAANTTLYSDAQYTVYIGGSDGCFPTIAGGAALHQGGAGWKWQNVHFTSENASGVVYPDAGLHWPKMQFDNCIIENTRLLGGDCVRAEADFYARNTKFILASFSGGSYHWIDPSSGPSYICDGCLFYSPDTGAGSVGIDRNVSSTAIFRGCVFHGAETVLDLYDYDHYIIEYCTFYNANDSASYCCVSNAGAANAGAEVRVGPTFRFYGNIFDGRGKGTAIHVKSARIESDYNVFNCSTAVKFETEGLSLSLAEWQAFPEAQDANSVAEDPQLTNPAGEDYTPKEALFGQTPVLPGTFTLLSATTRYDHMGTAGAVDPVGSYDDPTEPPTVVVNSGYTE